MLSVPNRRIPKENEHLDITMSVPALSLRALEAIYYCLSGFSALLKCYISCNDSELENVRISGIILCDFCSREYLDSQLSEKVIHDQTLQKY